MAGWSCATVSDDCEDTLKNVFDQVIPKYLREVYTSKQWARPLPAMLADGRPVDLFQLFTVVKMKGGFFTVTENGLWGSVAEECTFSAAQQSSVKLVYVIYVKELEGWLRKVFKDDKLMNGEFQNLMKLKYLVAESEEPKGLVCNDEDKRRNIGKLDGGKLDGGKHRWQLSDAYVFNLMHDKMEAGRLVEPGVCMTELLLSDGGGDLNKVNCIVKSSIDNGKDVCVRYDKSVVSAAKCIVDKVISTHKNIMCSESVVQKAQDEVQATSIDVDSEKLGVQDDYDIVISARNVVNNVISSIRSGSSSLREAHNVHEPVANTYDDEKAQDDYDIILLARHIARKVVDSHDKEKNLCPVDGISAVHESAGHVKGDYVKVLAEDDANVESSLTSVGNNVITSQARKLDFTSFADMLHWITQVAMNPHDPAIGVSPRPSKRKNHGGDKYWVQALSVREALLKRSVDANNKVSSLQKKLKMHPSMYEDDKDLLQSAKRARYSKKHPQSKSQICTCCDSGPASANKLSSSHKVQSCYHLDASDEEDTYVMRVSVGPHSQAEIPEWTGVASESDSKWLGIQMWAPEDDKMLVGKNVIGMGRQSSCDCFVSGSSECISRHIAETRSRLKLALGLLFYRWKFNCMGEEVLAFWTTEDEKRFKTMVHQDSNGLNKFWNNALKLFPAKTREELVSYYFNVLVLRRRSYQNHVKPEIIDSDDDET